MEYKVKISGITPYMQKRMDDQTLENWEKNRKLLIERPDLNNEDYKRAEFCCYRSTESGKCFIPGDHIKGALINAGGMVKAKVGNAKKSMKNIVAAMFFIKEDEIELPEYDAVDKRSAVNKNVKARVIVIRPKWTKWEAEFTLCVDNETITKQTIEEIIINAGNYIGIGSFRPTQNGSFGRFELVNISEN